MTNNKLEGIDLEEMQAIESRVLTHEIGRESADKVMKSNYEQKPTDWDCSNWSQVRDKLIAEAEQDEEYLEWEKEVNRQLFGEE